ncbi:MAG: hypothetical protein N2Z79_05395, partial [Candidatus Omnitrophica bacterium]|nr:hypothetical protein [Candidatus Omnitrophota bacterium]
MVIERIFQGMAYEIYKRFPQFNPIARDRLIKQAVSDYLRVNKKDINKEIEQLYLRLKDRYQDEDNKT